LSVFKNESCYRTTYLFLVGVSVEDFFEKIDPQAVDERYSP